jgi:hypothetical protein
MMRLHLEGEGSRVRRVASAEAALAFTGGFTPDLITLDLLLPGIDAWDFLKLWRRQATRTKNRRLPAVVLRRPLRAVGPGVGVAISCWPEQTLGPDTMNPFKLPSRT